MEGGMGTEKKKKQIPSVVYSVLLSRLTFILSFPFNVTGNITY